MPIGYGSNFPVPKLTTAEVGLIQIDKGSSGIWSLLTGILTGLITIATAGAGAGVALAVGLAGASINTAVSSAESGSINPVTTAIEFGAALIPGLSGVKNVATAGTKAAAEFITDTGESLADIGGKVSLEAAKDISGQSTAQIFNTGFNASANSIQFTAKQIAELNELFIKAGWSTGANTSSALSTAALEAGSDFSNQTRRNALNAGLTAEEIEKIAEITADIFNDAEKRLAAIRYLKSIGKLESIPFLNRLTDEGIVALLEGYGKQIVKTPFKTMVRNYVKALAHPSSSEFNEVFVQKIQLLFDGNDAGRAPIEAVYKRIKGYIDREFKALARLLNKANKLDKAFEDTGGLLVNSEVIIGYKEINQLDFGGQKLLQISFYPEPTKSAKNPQGKEPVFVFASKKQRKKLRQGGMAYYLRTWATSKNGRGTLFERGVKSLFGGLTFFTGFFKINAIRNILSLASNMSTGFFGKGGISEHGMFTGAWEQKFVDSFSRNWKNRIGRLTGRAIIGGAAKVFFGSTIGSFIGQEAQRAASQYVVPALTGQKVGSWQKAFVTSFQSNARRYARHNAVSTGKTNYYLQIATGNRNANIIQRTPGSFSAGKGALSQFRVKIPR